jgi:hypothetical protein
MKPIDLQELLVRFGKQFDKLVAHYALLIISCEIS